MTNKKPKNANGSQNTASTGVYFLSLTLENIRCFSEKQTLDLSDGEGKPAQWTILLGNNGTGKTTLLQAIVRQAMDVNAVNYGPSLHNTDATEQKTLSRMSFPFWDITQNFVRNASHPPTIRMVIARGIGPFRDANQGSHSEDKFEERGSDILQPSLSDPFPLIICYGYGAARRMAERSLPEDAPDAGIESLFSYHADLRNAEDWLLRADYAASKESPQRKRQQERLEQVKQLLLAVLPEIDDIQFLTGSGVYPIPRVEFHTPYGWVPLRQLGYGYQTVLGWMVDFVSRMIERYPESPDPLAEPAVVLVDEIDLHLHPQWQRQLIGHLSQRFPNTQFIVTAHSPLVVQAATGANLAVLRRDGDHVVIDNDVTALRNWRLDQVVTSDLFDLPSARPPQLDQLLERRLAILSKAHLTKKDERELAALDTRIGPLPGGETVEEAKRLALIEESLKLLQQAPKP